jgi:hypothetical protein
MSNGKSVQAGGAPMAPATPGTKVSRVQARVTPMAPVSASVESRLTKVEADIREIRSLITTIQAQIRTLTPPTLNRPAISPVGIVQRTGPTQTIRTPPMPVRRIIK